MLRHFFYKKMLWITTFFFTNYVHYDTFKRSIIAFKDEAVQ